VRRKKQKTIAQKIDAKFGKGTAELIKLEGSFSPRMAQTVQDDVVFTEDGKDYRPPDQLSYDTIDRMIKCGPIIFAIWMKLAQVLKIFSDGRYKVMSPDKKLARVAEESLKMIMPKMALDFGWSSVVYGVSFQQKLWELKTEFELGISKSRSAVTPYTVPKVPGSVRPSTVKNIERTSSGAFNGFVQQGRSINGRTDDIVVAVGDALVIPIDEKFGNMWGRSLLTPLYPLWIWYEHTMRALARYIEIQAKNVTVGRAPSNATVEVEGSTQEVRALDLVLTVASNVSRSTAVSMPSDRDDKGNLLWDLSQFDLGPDKSSLYLGVLEYLTQEMIRAMLSADRSVSQTSGGVGSYNIGEIHANASALTSEIILLQFLFFLNKYFMPDISLHNRGVGGPPIWLVTQPIDQQEKQTLMSLIGIMGNAPAGQEFMDIIDYRQMAETSNIPTLDEAEVQKKLEERNERSLKNQEDQQKLMQKFKVNQNGNKQEGGIPPKQKAQPAKKETTEQKLERLQEVMDNGELPLLLTVEDLHKMGARIVVENGHG
jgi:hypothetical protein